MARSFRKSYQVIQFLFIQAWILAALTCLYSSIAFSATSESVDAESLPPISIVTPDKLVAGQPLTVWIQRYWQWTRSFPSSNTPSDDSTGSKCRIRQNQSVFFLTGSSHSASVTRNCVIPKNKHVFIPIINVLAQNDNASPIPCNSYMKAVREVNDSAVDVSLTVNGKDIEITANYKAESGCFELNDASRGVSGIAAGAGYWVILEPLQPGKYEIHSSGKYSADGFAQDIKYQIEVE